jgi:hypothetical protein
MTREKEFVLTQKSTGDAAVDGLYGGMTAGLIMVGYLIVAGLFGGVDPGLTLSRFDPSSAPSPLTGAIAHMAVAGVYGAIFGLIWRWLVRHRPGLGRFGWLIGLIYGLGLWLLAESLTMRGPGSALLAIPLLHFAVGHAVFGLVLALVVHRQQRDLS